MLYNASHTHSLVNISGLKTAQLSNSAVSACQQYWKFCFPYQNPRTSLADTITSILPLVSPQSFLNLLKVYICPTVAMIHNLSHNLSLLPNLMTKSF